MRRLILTILLLITMNAIHAKDPATILNYIVRQPGIKSEKTPVIILLHGVGSNEKDLFSFAGQLPEKYLVISARAPIHLGGDSFAWYQVDFSTGKPVYNFEQEERSRNLIISFIEEIKSKYSLNADEIYLCGFSQGAIMSYSVALTRPDLVSGIAVMSGRLLEEIKPKIKEDIKVHNLKVFISHGMEDHTLSVNYAREAKAYLNTLGVNAKYTEYPAAHEINSSMLHDMIVFFK